MSEGVSKSKEREIAAAVREKCAEAALRAYEDAGIRGLCAEGRWECALEAMKSLALSDLLLSSSGAPSESNQD